MSSRNPSTQRRAFIQNGKMMSTSLRLSVFAVLALVYAVVAVPVPDTGVEYFEAEPTEAPAPPMRPTKSPRIPKIDEKDLGIPDEDYDDYEDDPDYLTWEDLGRMIYSWAKLFAEPWQLKPMRKCLTGNAPKDAAALIKRIEACVRIVDPDFSLRKIANLLLGS